MIWYLISSVLMGLAGFLVFFYYLRKGQFEELEEIKYQIFQEDAQNQRHKHSKNLRKPPRF